MNAQTRTYRFRIVISRPDEIRVDDDKRKPQPVEPMGVYILFESDQEAHDELSKFVAEKSVLGFTSNIVAESEFTLSRSYGPAPEDFVMVRAWVEPLPVAIVVPATTIDEIRQWFESLPLHAARLANPS